MPAARASLEKTDVAIVGCGVAGGMLAYLLARRGLGVVVLEKRPQVGVPIRCAEAAGSSEELSRFLPLNDRWICAQINGVKLVSPSGRLFAKSLPGVGIVLRRDLFDQALAERAASAGAKLRIGSEATALMPTEGRRRALAVTDRKTNRGYTIEAEVIVGAGGVEAPLARWARLREKTKPADIHSCLQYLLEGAGVPEDTIELHLGRAVAPGGYAWVFPKGNGMANVGVGVHPGMTAGRSARYYLELFVHRLFPQAKVRAKVAGATTGIAPLATMVADGILLVGEEAGQNNPFSGGGIMNALEGAEEAATVIMEAFAAGDFSERFLRRYDRRWKDRCGATLAKFAKLRRLFFTLSDREMDQAVTVLERTVAGREPDYPELFRQVFVSTPGLLWKARRLLW